MSTSHLVLNQLSEEQALRKRREELSELESRLAERESELANLQSSMRAFEGRYLGAVGERYDELAGIEKEIAKSAAARIVFTPTSSKSSTARSRGNSTPISPPALRSANIVTS